MARKIKEKTSFVALGAIFFAIAAFIVVPLYMSFYDKYTDSLHTDTISGNRSGIFLCAWFVFSFLSIVLSFLAIISAIISLILKRKFQNIGLAVLGILITFFVAALVMPTLGLAPSTRYIRKADEIAHKALEEFNQTSQGRNFLLKDYEN